MPPKKRALADADTNAQRPAKRNSTGKKTNDNGQTSKDQKNGNKTKNKKSTDLDESHISKRPAYTYITIPKPYWACDGDSDNGKKKQKDMFNKLASDHPKWPYVMMAETWRKLCDHIRLATYTNPDNFGMYVYNDFHAYGITELIENLLIDFNKAHAKKSVNDMWRIVSTLGNWLNCSETDIWLHSDDGARTEQTFGVIGCAFLTALEAIDRAGELHADSTYRDLGFAMAVFTKCALFAADIPLEEGLEWRPHIVAYAKKAGIDLGKVGCDGIEEALEEFEDVEALGGKKSGDRWEWKKKFKDLGPSGGDEYIIVNWTSEERADAAFDKVDPLKDVPDHVLRKGLLELA